MRSYLVAYKGGRQGALTSEVSSVRVGGNPAQGPPEGLQSKPANHRMLPLLQQLLLTLNRELFKYTHSCLHPSPFLPPPTATRPSGVHDVNSDLLLLFSSNSKHNGNVPLVTKIVGVAGAGYVMANRLVSSRGRGVLYGTGLRRSHLSFISIDH